MRIVTVIDPGHGGRAPEGRSTPLGIRSPNGLLEKDGTLESARGVAQAFLSIHEPRFVSGEATAFQLLDLVVADVRRGDLQVGNEVAVVAGMPHMGLGANGLPALNSTMFMPGVLVWANLVGDRCQAVEISTDGPLSAAGA